MSEQDILNNVKFWEEHKNEYIEINQDSNSIIKIYQRKKEQDDEYNTIYMFDDELLEKKSNEFIEGIKTGKTHYEDSMLNIGLILTHLSQRNDKFSKIANEMLANMMKGNKYE